MPYSIDIRYNSTTYKIEVAISDPAGVTLAAQEFDTIIDVLSYVSSRLTLIVHDSKRQEGF